MSSKPRAETDGLAPTIVRRMLASAAASGARRIASPAALPAARVSSLASLLQQLVVSSEYVPDDLEISIVRRARDAQSDFIAVVRGATAPSTRKTTVCASWWRLDVTVAHDDLVTLPARPDPIEMIINTIAGANDPFTAPFLQLVAAFIVDTLGLLRVLDRGHGALICMSWLAPGLLVPST